MLNAEREQQFGTGVMIAAAFSIHLLSLAVPILTLQVYDRILKYPHQGTLEVMVAGVVIAILLEWVAKTARSAIEARRSAQFEHGLYCGVMKSSLGILPGRADMRPASARYHDLNAIASLKDRYGGETATVFVELPFVALFLGIIAYLSGWVVVVPIVLLTIFTICALWLGEKLRLALAEREKAEEERDAVMLEALETIHLIKAMTIERNFLRRYEAVQMDVGVGGLATTCWAGGISALGSWCAQAMTIAVMACGAPMVIAGHLTTGALVATILLSGRLMQPMQRALGLWTRAQEFKLAESRLTETLSEPARVITLSPPCQPLGRLVAEHVEFRWSKDAEPLFKDLNLTMEPGEVVHITADPGSGSTTLLKLLAGIYEPSEGAITVDELEASRYISEELTRHVAYLPTSPVIYRGSVIENLTGFSPHKQDQALELAGLLGIAPAILRLPQGYETPLEGGTADAIPPGLAQRLTIVRALLEKSKLILFDQADRALDKEGYNHVFQLLGKLKGRASLVIVSGDHNLARFADTRLRLHQGQLLVERRNLETRPPVPLTELAG